MVRDDRVETAAVVASLRRGRAEKAGRELVLATMQGQSALDVLRDRLGPPSLMGDPLDEDLDSARREIDAWENDGIQVIALGDDRYPNRLRDVFDRPALLFARGTVITDDLGVAIVGSRHVSPTGIEIAERLAEGVVGRGLTVVSGLAAGVDTAAHRAAIQAAGRTVAFIGTGIRKHFPPQNRELHRHVADHGAVFSQFWPDQPHDKTTFPQRNGTMSGYSVATIIVEASERSGTRIQARKAVEHGRPVVLMKSVATGTDWGREMATKPDVHVASSVDEALAVIDSVLDRPRQLEDLLSSIG
ncbi:MULTISPECIES: DNA-processing protein DprA [Nocardia]|uniref:DNA-processing protein DprA n=2 Tax=Nocardia TaxID=1817 RepID=A0A2T2Z920_9NOCA|nr:MULTISPECIES: DNA-processing protein DprA [Nocardia]MBF6446220.1 DNA-protecting protein DprA [Nocardia elegans]PSR64255.1 DNA-processing protein DprA [Nocardia nova]